MKNVFIFNGISNHAESDRILVTEKLIKHNINICSELNEDIDLILCVGGDGTFLKLVQQYQFPTIPICGINTGHLGFFQEVGKEDVDEFIEQFLNGKLEIQPYNIVKAEITQNGKTNTFHALNEFAFRNITNNPVHLNISINNSFIEKFSGDGILVSSPAGSTAYNYSLSGSIVDPRLNILQVTPIAPMNSSVYRSLMSSILLPFNDKVIVTPQDLRSSSLQVLYDGEDQICHNIEKIVLTLSKRKINLVRFGNQTFWDKIKDKFL